MNIDTLHDLLIHIMKGKIPATILSSEDEFCQHQIYGGSWEYGPGNYFVKPMGLVSEIISVQRDFLVIKTLNKSVPQAPYPLLILPISKIKGLLVDQDFIKGE